MRDTREISWRPTEPEVQRIVVEMRPLLRELARRDQEQIAKEILRRRQLRARLALVG
jgi:hypothetical protein